MIYESSVIISKVLLYPVLKIYKSIIIFTPTFRLFTLRLSIDAIEDITKDIAGVKIQKIMAPLQKKHLPFSYYVQEKVDTFLIIFNHSIHL